MGRGGGGWPRRRAAVPRSRWRSVDPFARNGGGKRSRLLSRAPFLGCRVGSGGAAPCLPPADYDSYGGRGVGHRNVTGGSGGGVLFAEGRRSGTPRVTSRPPRRAQRSSPRGPRRRCPQTRTCDPGGRGTSRKSETMGLAINPLPPPLYQPHSCAVCKSCNFGAWVRGGCAYLDPT